MSAPLPERTPAKRRVRLPRAPLLALCALLLLSAGCDKHLYINDDAVYTNSRNVQLKLNYSSADYGTYKITTRENGDYWSSDVQMKIDRPGVTMAYTLRTAGDGVKRIEGKGNKRIFFGWSGETDLDPDTIILDTTPPNAAFTINGGAAFTNNRNVTLNHGPSDATSGVATRQSSEDTGSPGTEQAHAASSAFTLTAAQGGKTVFTRYKDNAGNWSGWTSRAILLDTVVPTVTLSAPGNNATVSNRRPALSWTASDSFGGSGLQLLPFRITITNTLGTYLDTGWISANPFAPLSDMPYGTYQWNVAVRDAAGNVATSATWSFTLVDTSAPVPEELAILSPYGATDITPTSYVQVRCAATDATAVQAVFLSTRPGPAPAPNQAATPGQSSGWLPFTVPGVSVAGGKRSSQAFPFSLPAGDGTKRLYAWFKDTNPANPVSSRIDASTLLDGTPPLAGGAPPVALVETLAGDGVQRYRNGTGAAASFMGPQGLAALPDGSLLLADYQNDDSYIRKLANLSPNAAVVTNVTNIWSAADVAYVPANNCLYGCDEVCTILVRYNVATGVKTRLESPAALTYGSAPKGVFHDAAGARLIVSTADGKLHAAHYSGAHAVLSPGPFSDPRGICRDPFGAYYVAEAGGNRIVRIMPDGTAIPHAGTGSPGAQDGVGSARFAKPAGVASDAWGNLYVADFDNHRIRRVHPSGEVTTVSGSAAGFADGSGSAAQFKKPYGIHVDGSGILYVADKMNFRVRRVLYDSPQGLEVNGGATVVHNRRVRLALASTDAGGAVTGFYVAESATRPALPLPGAPQAPPAEISPNVWYSTTEAASASLEKDFTLTAGDGLKSVWAFFRDKAGNVSQPVVRRIQLDLIPPLELVAGSLDLKRQDGARNPAAISSVAGLRFVLNAAGRLPTMLITHWLVTESDAVPGSGDPRWHALPAPANSLIDYEATVTTYALSPGDGPKSYYAWFKDQTETVSPLPPALYRRNTILDSTPPVVTNFKIFEPVNGGAWALADAWVIRTGVRLRIDAADAGLGVAGWCVKQDSGSTPPAAPGNNDPAWNAVGPVADFRESVDYTLTRANETKKLWLYVRDVGGLVASHAIPVAVTLDTVAPVDGTTECEMARVAGNVNGSYGVVDGNLSTAKLRGPNGIVIANDGSYLIADSGNHSIRRVARDGTVTTLAGNRIWNAAGSFADGSGADARFNTPQGIALDRDGSCLIADSGNHRIRRMTTTGGIVNVTTVAGTGIPGDADGPEATARFNSPRAVTVDRDGSYLVSDSENHRIRRIRIVSGSAAVETVAGSGVMGSTNGPAATAQFAYPHGIVVDVDGSYVIADLYSHKIRRIAAQGGTFIVSTVAGDGVNAYKDGDAPSAEFFRPFGIDIDGDGSHVIVDSYNGKLRRLTRGATGFLVTTLSREFAVLREAAFVAVDRDGSYLVASCNSHRLMRFDPRPSGLGLQRTADGILLTSEETLSGVAGFYLSYTPAPPPAAMPAGAQTAFSGDADLDKWIKVTGHVVSHLPFTREIAFLPAKDLHGWFRDAAGNVSSMATLRKDDRRTGMKAVAQLGGSGILTKPKHVAVGEGGAILAADGRTGSSPVIRFAGDFDPSGSRLGRAGDARDEVSRQVGGIASLQDGAFAVAETGKRRIGLYDPAARFAGTIARRVDLAANLHGLGTLPDLQARIGDKYSLAGGAPAGEARIYPGQNPAAFDPAFAAATIEIFADDRFDLRITEPVQVSGLRILHLQIRGGGSGGDGEPRTLLLTARSTADPRGIPVQLVETAPGSGLFHGQVFLDLLPAPERGRLGVGPGNGIVTFEIPGRSVTASVATSR